MHSREPPKAVIEQLDALLGGAAGRVRPTTGGDSFASWFVERGDVRLFVKVGRPGDAPWLAAEAEGLQWLAAAQAVRVPAVRGLGSDDTPWLALEWIDVHPATADAQAELGRALARLHRAGAPSCGHGRDNFMGRVPQDNRIDDEWARFYGERRLLPLVRRTRDAGSLEAPLAAAIEGVVARLPALVGPPEPPARLHGDLWAGNVLFDAARAPVLVDPAVYGGHREVDLAMMRLFGGFARACFDAYDEVAPLAPGAAERVPLYQLYPLLVHVAMFGDSWCGRLASCVDALR
ncbi:MAG: fructosamine kinase family protein [Deltaproteobacteria bacterium]|nr:fructosamine kinase family protein [Deltaproteobacteria bacterium]MBK8238003.1 fructosamine kinase family protein [Deltaproteobacteria bacterium]MBK8718654.1 fructosamine kinase family protein [Deltaproteobacteria bacterium]